MEGGGSGEAGPRLGPNSELGFCRSSCPLCPSPELVSSLKLWPEWFPADSVKSASVPGERLFRIFLEFKGVMLGSQGPLSKTNKQLGFYFGTMCNFEL